jgi:membrane protease YdiL (CAAX protease family)
MTPRARLVAIASPFVLVGASRALQYLFGGLGVWAWVPTILFFWAAIAALAFACAGREGVSRWWQPARNASAWSALAVFMGLLSLPQFVLHWRALETPLVVGLWLAFAAVNPWFEEAYWRGLLLDATGGWNRVLSVLYSSALFAISHPLIWGVHSVPQRNPVIVPVLMAVGLVWAVTYRRTGSLRWTLVGHVCANLFGMGALVLLNLHDPAPR